MAVQKKGLGKGLDSLIPDNKPAKKNTETVQKVEEKKEEMKDGVQMMKISMIEPNREQPRKKFEEDALALPFFSPYILSVPINLIHCKALVVQNAI